MHRIVFWYANGRHGGLIKFLIDLYSGYLDI
jgi:hypothetical protein